MTVAGVLFALIFLSPFLLILGYIIWMGVSDWWNYRADKDKLVVLALSGSMSLGCTFIFTLWLMAKGKL